MGRCWYLLGTHCQAVIMIVWLVKVTWLIQWPAVDEANSAQAMTQALWATTAIKVNWLHQSKRCSDPQMVASSSKRLFLESWHFNVDTVNNKNHSLMLVGHWFSTTHKFVGPAIIMAPLLKVDRSHWKFGKTKNTSVTETFFQGNKIWLHKCFSSLIEDLSMTPNNDW